MVFAVGFCVILRDDERHRPLQVNRNFLRTCRGGFPCPTDSFTVIWRRGQAARPTRLELVLREICGRQVNRPICCFSFLLKSLLNNAHSFADIESNLQIRKAENRKE